MQRLRFFSESQTERTILLFQLYATLEMRGCLRGLQANQDVTFLTDGGEEIRALTEFVTPASEHVLDWFHITMRVTVLEQYARGVAHHNEAAGARPQASPHSELCWVLE